MLKLTTYSEASDADSLRTAAFCEDIREYLRPSEPADVLFPLSAVVLKLLEEAPGNAEPLPNGLPQRLVEVMQASEIIWKGPFARQKMVFKCAANIVVKA